MQDIKLVDTGDVSRIGSNALNSAGKLVRILAGDKLKQIGDMAFANCENLKIVRIQSVEQIGKEAFAGAASIVDDVDVRSAKSIGEGAFKGCTGMTDILLGESLQSLGKEAFASCSALETFMLPDSLVSMGEGCFRDSNTQHDDLTIYYRAGNSTWDVVGDNWNGIPVVGLDKFYTERQDHYSFANTYGSFGFRNCKKLQFVIIPKKVTAIGNKAFAGCTNLNYMLVKSNKIKSVGSSAFQGITSKMTVKTSKTKWRKYAAMFTGRGKMSHNALFVIDPVKLKYKGRLY